MLTDIGPCECCGPFDCCTCNSCCYSTNSYAMANYSLLDVVEGQSMTAEYEAYLRCIGNAFTDALSTEHFVFENCIDGISWSIPVGLDIETDLPYGIPSSSCTFTIGEITYTREMYVGGTVRCSGSGLTFQFTSVFRDVSDLDPDPPWEFLDSWEINIAWDDPPDSALCCRRTGSGVISISSGGTDWYFYASAGLFIYNNQCCGVYYDPDVTKVLLGCRKESVGCDGLCTDQNPLL